MKRLSRALAVIALLSAFAHCGDGTGPQRTPSPAAIVVTPDSISLRVGQSLQMHLLVLDSTGDTLSGQPATWSTSNTAILTINAAGLATAKSYGVAHITARLDSLTDSARLRVLVPVRLVALSPSAMTLVLGGNLHLTASLEGVDGNILSDRDVDWSHQTGTTMVTAGGMIKALQTGQDTVRAVSEGVASHNSVSVNVVRPAFVKVVSSEEAVHTCALTSVGSAFCWGANEWGALGTGTYGDSTGNGAMGQPGTAGIAYPTGVTGLPAATAIIAGDGTTCAVEGSQGSVYCWGFNDEGSLGTLGIQQRNTPGLVPNLTSIQSLVAGSEWECALGSDSIAYCWGGSVTGFLVPPAAVSSRKYLALAGGFNTLCGIGTDSLAYCGFPNTSGQPLVSGSPKFTKLAVGHDHQCGLATDSTAYCWGQNSQGQLGDSTPVNRFTPGPVLGGLKFVDIAAGFQFNCAILAGSGEAHCWGVNLFGALGRTGPSNSNPLPISGSIAFSQITAGAVHACGLSVGGKVYCWGGNEGGQLGDGTSTNRFAPVLVAGQQP